MLQDPAIQGCDIDEGPAEIFVGGGYDGDHRGFIKGVGTVLQQADPFIG